VHGNGCLQRVNADVTAPAVLLRTSHNFLFRMVLWEPSWRVFLPNMHLQLSVLRAMKAGKESGGEAPPYRPTAVSDRNVCNIRLFEVRAVQHGAAMLQSTDEATAILPAWRPSHLPPLLR
jgi:hypothetical protein